MIDYMYRVGKEVYNFFQRISTQFLN